MATSQKEDILKTVQKRKQEIFFISLSSSFLKKAPCRNSGRAPQLVEKGHFAKLRNFAEQLCILKTAICA